jgi:hypothetical protein
VNHTDPHFSEFTPLHWACLYGHVEVVRVLLGPLRAYAYPLDRSGRAPWFTAMAMYRCDIVAELRQRGGGFPLMLSVIPLNKSTVDDPFTCTNEFLNPGFITCDLWRTYNLRHVEGCVDSQLLPPTVAAFQPHHCLGPAHGVLGGVTLDGGGGGGGDPPGGGRGRSCLRRIVCVGGSDVC